MREGKGEGGSRGRSEREEEVGGGREEREGEQEGREGV